MTNDHGSGGSVTAVVMSHTIEPPHHDDHHATGDVASTGVDARPERSTEDNLSFLGRIIASTRRHAERDGFGLAELHTLNQFVRDLTTMRDELARRLLADDASYREIGMALGIGRTGAERRYRGASNRPAGGQPGTLR